TSPDTIVTDVLDGWLDESTLSNISGWGGSYDHTNRTITWTVGSIAPGGSWGVTFSVNVRAIQNVFLLIRNTSFYSAALGGTGHSNTVETPVLPIVTVPVEPPVIPPPPPSIAINVTAPDPLCVGAYLPYRVCFTNGTLPYTYTVDFADGTPIVTGTTSSSCVTLEHAYLEIRQYPFSVAVHDGKGMESTHQETFNPRDCSTKTIVYHHNFFIGYPDGTFQPEGNITRAEMAAAMSRALGLGWSIDQSGFSDVAPNHWATGHITLMKQKGFMQGDPGGTFRPDDPITRAEAAAAFLRIAGMSPVLNPSSSSFKDVQPTSWAAGYIEAARQAGLLQGYPDNTFKPTDFLSRAEFATLASDALGRQPTNTNPWEKPENVVQFPDVTRAHWAYIYIVEVSTPHMVTNPTRLTRVITLKDRRIPLFSEGADGIITFLHLGDTITAIVPVDGLQPDGSDPTPRQLKVRIIERERP
ncbi:MAG: S-layer homology domain-containing protein, partial [Caldiserica bacterium]|nr:S-layer homology domain-containing protein [Caldisericota bacterium]